MMMMADARRPILLLLLLFAASVAAAASAKKNELPVFVLVGQSNMVGMGMVSGRNETTGRLLNGTLEYLLHDPRTAKQLRRETFETGKWKVFDNIKTWFNTGHGYENNNNNNKTSYYSNNSLPPASRYGNLTVGFGKDATNIGPEFGFGIALNQGFLQDRPFVILKNAWGGMSLAQDFRPPSSTKQFDPYCQDASKNCNPLKVGDKYIELVRNIKAFLQPGALAQLFPELDRDYRPVLAGMGWFQGWNDGCDLNYTAAYEPNLVNFIHNIRREFGNNEFPFVIAVSGFYGYNYHTNRTPPDCWTNNKLQCHCDGGDTHCTRLDVILSQQAAARRVPNAIAVETRGYWRQKEYCPIDFQDYHFNHNAETYYWTGKAMGKGMLELLLNNKTRSSSSVS